MIKDLTNSKKMNYSQQLGDLKTKGNFPENPQKAQD